MNSNSPNLEASPQNKKYVLHIAKELKHHYPDPVTELNYQNEMQLAVAVLLSAQTTDIKVNEVTAELFKKYKSWEDFANADLEQLQEDIYGVNFHKTKAQRLIDSGELVSTKFQGSLPKDIKQLTELPGVARKSANVILQELWGITQGIVVDTHVKRVSNRLGLVDSKNAKKIEKELMDILPKEFWRNYSGAVVLHGRYVCKARKPQCTECFLNKVCPSAFEFDA